MVVEAEAIQKLALQHPCSKAVVSCTKCVTTAGAAIYALLCSTSLAVIRVVHLSKTTEDKIKDFYFRTYST